ncbi:MAG: hypothetical protein ACI4JC_11170 [Faecalibacterium sp.]
MVCELVALFGDDSEEDEDNEDDGGGEPLLRIVQNEKVSDYHAILPTRSLAEFDQSTLPGEERNILLPLAENKGV